MEARSGSHHWGRRLLALGLQPLLIAPHFVTPCRMDGKGGKNDANDAAAICEAASRPKMRFVPVKSTVQQGMLCIHRMREAYKEDRTACNRIRGLLSEFGLVFPQRPDSLRAALAATLEVASNELPGSARLVLDRAFAHWRALEVETCWCGAEIAKHAKDDVQARQLTPVLGIGPTTASALIASAGDFRLFRSASQFAAWLGLVPRQNSSGGKISLGGITKRGDNYLRTLLIQGARSAVCSAPRRSDAISRWLVQLQQRAGWQKTLIALANKNARVAWAILMRGRPLRALCSRGGCTGPRHLTYRTIVSSPRPASEDAPNRSDRQRVNSANR